MFKSFFTVGNYTLLSRVLGLVRDLVFAHQFGASAHTDAFFVAFKIPNFLRRLFGEGAFATAFVPVLTEYKVQRDFKDLKQLVDHVAGTLGLVLLIVSLVGVVVSPLIIALFAPGFWWGDGPNEKFWLAADMLRLTYPYLFFISLTAFAGGILNSHNKFAVPAFTPVLLNVSMIACAIFLAPQMDVPIVALAWGVLIAGIVQFTFQIPYLMQLKLLPKPKPSFKDEGVRRILKLMAPALFAVSVTQINLMLDTILASFLVSGSISWLYYSDRLMEFPLGILGVALGTVLLPHLSHKKAEESPEGFNHTMDWGLRVALLLGVPSACGLMVLAGPMISTLFQSDVFTPEDVMMARQSLMAYSVGLLAFIMIKVLAPGYYARQDTKTPVRIAIIAMVANMVFNLILIFPLAHAGLALATSLSAMVNAYLLLHGLRKINAYQPEKGWWKLFAQVALAGGAMVVVLMLAFPAIDQWVLWSTWERIQQLALAILAGAVSYFVVLILVGIRPRHFMAKR